MIKLPQKHVAVLGTVAIVVPAVKHIGLPNYIIPLALYTSGRDDDQCRYGRLVGGRSHPSFGGVLPMLRPLNAKNYSQVWNLESACHLQHPS